MSEEFLQPTSNTNEGKGQHLPEEKNPIEILELEGLIEELPKEEQTSFKQLIFAYGESTSWQGPLPPPEVLKRYNEAVTDGAERIFQMAERDSLMEEKKHNHIIDMEKLFIPKQERREDRGMNYAFIISLALIIISAILIYKGHDLAGTALGTIDIIGLVTVFIVGKRMLNKDSE